VEDKNVPVEDAIHQAYGMTAADFDKTLRDYFGSRRYMYYKMATPPDIASAGYAATPVSNFEANLLMAEIHLQSSDYREKARTELEELQHQQPKHAGVLRDLGIYSLDKKDYTQAAQYFRQAIQADSKDARVHYYYATLMQQSGEAVGNSEKNAEVKRELETSVALDPNYADAYSMLAFARNNAGDKKGALEAAEKAVALSPRNERYLYNLSQIYLNTQRVDDAMIILKHLSASSDPGVAEHAAQSLAQAASYAELQKQQNMMRVRAEQAAAPEDAPPETSAAVPVATPMHFLKGTLKAVDCSGSPGATVSLAASGKVWAMHVRDTQHVVLIGADKFSCSWANVTAGVNYREAGEGKGEVISLEIQ
jgi:tetratricopeptide (TPR) repeat protein